MALAESSFAKNVGCRVDVSSQGLAPEFVLFSEDASRIVISCDPASVARIKEVAGKHGVSADALGETVSVTVEIRVEGRVLVSANIGDLRTEYEGALERALRSEPTS